MYLISEYRQNDTDEEKENIIWSIFILGIIYLVCGLIRSYGLGFLCLMCNRNLHNQMNTSILRSISRYFDENPSGRIINRFSNDTGILDSILIQAIYASLEILIWIFVLLVRIMMINQYLIIALCIEFIFIVYFT